MDLLPKPKLKDRVLIYVKAHWPHLLVACLFAIGVVAAVYTNLLQKIYYDRPGQAIKVIARTEDPNTRPSPLTGVRVPIDLADNQVLAVMMENSPDARPQSSLSQAGVVFETVAEGGITRYLALYQETRPKVIGPVRSLRPYYLDWAMGYDAAIAHAGGSAQALQLATQRKAKSMNGLVYGAGFYRTGDRVAPHNLYTSGSRLDSLATELGYKSSTFTPYTRVRKEKKSAQPTHTTISVGFSGSLYATTWKYQAKTNTYARNLAGSADKDRENNKQLTVKNLVLIPIKTTYDGTYAVMDTTSKGSAVLFRDGVAIKGTWQKSTPTDMIKLTDSTGKAMQLNPGSTWFAFVPSHQSYSY
ncbi:DUF3048 domain-containing protein [Candidatus Microgenomates bacterium]|nr:DUF3048 domain-containing protein [Candidatus Microgenomates bacterium]